MYWIMAEAPSQFPIMILTLSDGIRTKQEVCYIPDDRTNVVGGG